MAVFDVHLAQAKHNEKLSNRLGARLASKDWFVTTAFYAAIHYIEAALFSQSPGIQHSDSYHGGSFHDRRDNCVKDFFPSVESQYKSLKDLCFIVRYLRRLNQPAQDYLSSTFPDNDNLKTTVKDYLKDIKVGTGIL